MKEDLMQYSNWFKYDVGKVFNDAGRDLIITRREVRKKNNIKYEYYKYTCNKCGWTEGWKKLGDLDNFGGCSCCNGKTVVPEINSIWVKAPWMIDLGVSEEDAKKYTKSSAKKIEVTCPDCKRKKGVVISRIYNRKSIGCTCGDGFSYPEKFMSYVLDSLKVEYVVQYSPKWIKRKRYDFYIPSLNMIIETHGEQHYEQTSRKGARTLAEEQENDRVKRELALVNGIVHYIELDCRKSTLEWIRNSILNSELYGKFDLSSVNWLECEEFALKNNKIKEVCVEWSKEQNITKIVKMFKISTTTTKKYLNKGSKLGWCDFNPKSKLIIDLKKSRRKQVEIYKDGKSLGVFKSCSELARQSEKLFGVRLIQGNIWAVCNEYQKQHKDFTFRYV